MTFSRASSRPTSSTYSWIFITYQRCATRTFSLFPIKERTVASIKILIFFISWCFHCIKDIKSPINCVVHIHVFICAYITHSSFTCHTEFKSFNIRIVFFFMYLTIWNILSHRLYNWQRVFRNRSFRSFMSVIMWRIITTFMSMIMLLLPRLYLWSWFRSTWQPSLECFCISKQ